MLICASLDNIFLENLIKEIKFIQDSDGSRFNHVLKSCGYFDQYYELKNQMEERYQERQETFNCGKFNHKDSKWQSAKSKYNNSKKAFESFCQYINPILEDEIERQMSKFNNISFDLYKKIEFGCELIVEKIETIDKEN